MAQKRRVQKLRSYSGRRAAEQESRSGGRGGAARIGARREVDEGGLAVGTRLLEQRKRRVAVSKPDVRKREMIARHIAALARLRVSRPSRWLPHVRRQAPWHARARPAKSDRRRRAQRRVSSARPLCLPSAEQGRAEQASRGLESRIHIEHVAASDRWPVSNSPAAYRTHAALVVTTRQSGSTSHARSASAFASPNRDMAARNCPKNAVGRFAARRQRDGGPICVFGQRASSSRACAGPRRARRAHPKCRDRAQIARSAAVARLLERAAARLARMIRERQCARAPWPRAPPRIRDRARAPARSSRSRLVRPSIACRGSSDTAFQIRLICFGPARCRSSQTST